MKVNSFICSIQGNILLSEDIMPTNLAQIGIPSVKKYFFVEN